MNKRLTRLLVLGDIHANANALLSVLHHAASQKPDFVVSVGDIGPDVVGDKLTFDDLRANLFQAETMASLLAMDYLKKPVIYVFGNHDLPVQAFCKASPNLYDVDVLSGGKTEIRNEVGFLGLGGSPISEFFWLNEWEDSGFSISEKHLKSWHKAPSRVLIAHTPPIRSWLDIDISHSRHLGSESVRGLLESMEKKPDVLLCGHIHEGFGVDIVSGTPCINAGSLVVPPNDSSIGANPIVMFEMTRYMLVDLFENGLEARVYQSSHVALHPFIESRVFLVKDGEILLRMGRGAYFMPSSDTHPPSASPAEFIPMRRPICARPSPSAAEIAKLIGRMDND